MPNAKSRILKDELGIESKKMPAPPKMRNKPDLPADTLNIPEPTDLMEEMPAASEPQAQKQTLQIQLSPELEKEIVDIVREDKSHYEDIRDSRDYGLSAKGEKKSFKRFFKDLVDLYNARREAKILPWKFCSNRSLRIAAAILDMLHARMLPAVVNPDLLNWKSKKTVNKQKLERIEKLMSWWLWVNSSMQEFFDSWIKQTIGFGDSLTETSWDIMAIDKGETIEQPITGPDGQQLMEQDGTPATTSFRDLHLIEKTVSRTFKKDQVFLPRFRRHLETDTVIIEEEMLYRELEEGEEKGQFVNVLSNLKPLLSEMEMKSSSMPEEEMQKIMNVRLRNKTVKVERVYMHFDADGDGFKEDIRFFVSLEHNVYLGGIAVKDLTASGKRPITFQEFDNRIDRPEETDGEGILEKVKELAEEIDAIFNQLTDANSLSVLRPGFYDPAGDLDAPVLRLAPNKMQPVTDPQRNILFPDLSINIQNLILAIRLVLEFVERLTAASSYALGKESEIVGGSGTATRTNAIMASAEVRFETPARRLRRGAAKIITQHLDLVQKNIPPGMEQFILGEDGIPLFSENELSELGISGEYDAFLMPDPAEGSKQLERQLAEFFYNMLMPNPLIGTDPVKMYKVTADLIKSWEKNPEEYLGPEPKMDDIDSPEDENTLIIQGDFARVRPQIYENHLLHIQTHSALLQSPSLAALPPHLAQQVMQFTQSHIQEHHNQMGLLMALQQQIAGGSSGRTPGGPAGGGQANAIGGPENTSQSPGVGEGATALGRAMETKRAGQSQNASPV